MTRSKKQETVYDGHFVLTVAGTSDITRQECSTPATAKLIDHNGGERLSVLLQTLTD